MADRLILDRYKEIETIGTGGFGSVIVAWDMRIQRKVAIKTIKLSAEQRRGATLSLKSDPSTRATVRYDQNVDDTDDPTDEHWLTDIPGLDEARTAAMLQDQNIVGVYDFEIKGSMAYLIMEYVEGLTLTEFMARHDDAMSLDIIAAVFDSVAHALTVAHKNGVLHLDIKPDNILINREGVIKVTDFGLATLADSQGYGTAGGGTIGYMPLEQMRQESLDASSDQWSLASVVYEMIAGNNPFFADDLDAAEEAIEEAELVLPSLCWDGLDSRIDDVIFTALDPNPDERYASVADFAADLDKYIGRADEGKAELVALMEKDFPSAQSIVAGPQDIEADFEVIEDGRPRGLAKFIPWMRGNEDGNVEDDAGEDADGEDDEEEWEPRVPLIERLNPIFFKRTSHILSFLATVIISFVACMNLPDIAGVDLSGLTNWYMWGIIAILGIFGAWKEHLGFLLSFIVLSFSLFMNQAYIVAVVLLIVVGAWWWFIGRHGAAFSNCALSFPVFGAINFGPMAPLVSGYCLSLFDAFFTTLLGVVIAFVLGGFGSSSLIGWNVFAYWNIAGAGSAVQTNIVGMLTNLETWCIVLSWILCAVVMSLCGIKNRSWLKILGAVVGTAILIAGECGATFLAMKGMTFIPEMIVLIPTIVAGVIMVIVVIQQNRYFEAQDNLQ